MSKPKFSILLTLFLATAFIGFFVTIVGSAPAPEDESIPDELAAKAAKATKEEAAELVKKSENNLRRIALAFHLYHDTFGAFPHNIKDKDGKVLLSWRVAILPYLEQDELYKQFKLEEPWNSEDNKKLLGKMPDVFNSPRVVVKKKGFTVYEGFAGKGTLFEPGAKVSIRSIADGLSNTIMAVESSNAVPWTKPADLSFDMEKDLPDIGKAYEGKPLAALCDGSVRILNLKTLTQQTLKDAIDRADGRPLGADW